MESVKAKTRAVAAAANWSKTAVTNAAVLLTPRGAAVAEVAVAGETEKVISSHTRQPCNAALQQEVAAFLAQERAADSSAVFISSSHHKEGGGGGARDGISTTRMSELDGGGERVAYPQLSNSTDGFSANEKINPCTCSTAVFDRWLRAVVVSIPTPNDAMGQPHSSDHPGRGLLAGTLGASQPSSSPVAPFFFSDASQQRTVSREHALYAALELLEAAARLLQRRLSLSQGRDRLLQAYYFALEEDINGVVFKSSIDTIMGKIELKPTVFHRELRTRKREVPLQHYSAEQTELEARLDKVFYVLRKLEEIEGLSNSTLIEGRETLHHPSGAAANVKGDAGASLLCGGSQAQMDRGTNSDLDNLMSDDAEAESPQNASPNTAIAATSASPSRRLVAIERRVRRMRSELNLPLAPAEITSRLRNELILSFSARVLALREPAPFTSETYSSESSSATSNNSSFLPALPPTQDKHTHSISAFVEWYVQHIMDPPAMSQLLTIVPHEYVVTTSCRLVYACEAHASLRASRALPDLGAVLLRAVTEGRVDAMAQLVLSSSVSYGSVLAHSVNSPTCFYAGLVGGQLDVVGRLVVQQCWDAEALHVLLFLGAPWGRASATNGCHSYQKTLLSRVWRVLQLAERGLHGGDAGGEYNNGDENGDDTPAEKVFTRRGSVLNDEDGSSNNSDSDSNAAFRKADNVGRDAAAVAAEALKDAGLLDSVSSADGTGILQIVSALFATAPSSAAAATVVSAASSLHGKGGGDHSVDSVTEWPASTRSNVSSFLEDGTAAGAFVAPGAAPPLPAFLDGGLQKLRLLFAARNGMLKYEAHLQDAQWATLLQQPQQSHPAAAKQLALRRRASCSSLLHGNGAPREDGATLIRDNGSSESTFSAVLKQKHLDALSPAATCPMRCQMCPGFSTPSLQRVDALSYGPLQPTTPVNATSTLEEVPTAVEQKGEDGMVVSDHDEDGNYTTACTAAAISHLQRADEVNGSGAEEQPVRALLIRADTAIESTPDAWYAYWWSAPSVDEPTTGSSAELESGDLHAAEDVYSAANNTWRPSSVRLQSQCTCRYSDTYAIEEYLQAVLSAKRRRARRTLYGGVAAATVVESVATTSGKNDLVDTDDVGEEEDGRGPADGDANHTFLRYVLSDNNSNSSRPHTTTRSSAHLVSTRTVYFEVHLSLNYLLALYDATSLSPQPLTAETAKHSVSSNSVVVGLCDEAMAVAANGCTRGPHQPHPVAHLGHTCDPTAAMPNSAGVSVSVVAHYTRFPSTSSVNGFAGDVKTEVVFLAVWQHKSNSANILAWEGVPIYLRVEVPRYSGASSKAAYRKPELCTLDEEDVNEDTMLILRDLDRSSNDAAPPTNPTHDRQATPTATFLPTVSAVSPQEAHMAVAESYHECQEQQENSETPSLAVLPTTVAVGLLYTPATDTLRLRINNYIYPGELNLGMAAASSTTDTRSSQDCSCPPARLYPAATLSLDEYGWDRWYLHQTKLWARSRQRRTGVAATPTSASSTATADNSALNNAVIRFAFDPVHLLYRPPLRAGVPHKGGITPRAVATGTAPSSRTAPHKSPAVQHHQPRGELVALLDASCKFAQLLRVLTNVATLAGLTSSQRFQQQQPSATTPFTPRFANRDMVTPVFEGGLATSTSGASAASIFGSRDRRVRDALTSVQEMLNAPAAEGSLFFPPVRVYHHSSHCPPQDLYPLPPPPKSSSDECGEPQDRTKREKSGATTSAVAAASPQPQPMRRQLGAGLSTQPVRSAVATGGQLYWHEVIPENARLTPLCAALASRQPAMAYAICTHPLTSFCDLGDEAQNRVQQQQRRTALYAACALGYADVLAVLLERIPIEEILSYFGLVIEGEARAALQQSYTRAEALFLRNYRLNMLSTPNPPSSSYPTQQQQQRDLTQQSTSSGSALHCLSSSPAVAVGAVRNFCTNECQRALIDVSSVYSTTRPLYTPLHVALLGVIREGDDDDDADDDAFHLGDVDGADNTVNSNTPWTCDASTSELCKTEATWSMASHYSAQTQRGLRRQTACATLLLNCLYDLLLVAPAGSNNGFGGVTSTGRIPSTEKSTATPTVRHSKPTVGETNSGDKATEATANITQKRLTTAGAELLVSALNLQSRAGETALLLAVRHNNCPVATRLLRLGAQAACMDRVTHLFTLELACANRCSPMVEALLQAPSSPYVSSPVLLNHAGIATALCWCAINNMHTVLQMLLRCDGVDVSTGFEGSSPLQLAITFGSEEAALALLSGTQPKTAQTAAVHGGSAPDQSKSRHTAQQNKKGNDNNGEQLRIKDSGVDRQQTATLTKASSSSPPATSTSAFANLSTSGMPHEKPFMDVNVPHDRTRCTALHLACERGQLRVVRTLLQQWHAQLNTPAASTNYTPLLSALANGREDAALCILEYSKDELRRGRAVLDLTAIDQNGDTALHLAARRGLVMAMEYMLVQFCEEEVTRLAQLHPQLRSSPAFLTATCIVPLHAVNKQDKSALLVAIQYDQADAAEVLVSTLIDGQEGYLNSSAPDGGDGERDEPRQVAHVDHNNNNVNPGPMASLFGGPLIDGTCMALHQALKKRLYTVIELMLSSPASARIFPASQAFREAAQQRAAERRGNRVRTARASGSDNNQLTHSKSAARNRASGQNRSSFVRLLLTRAAGPTISPSGALHLLFTGFVLPELCVYLSDVAAESAVLGVQHGTAMAHAELLMGFLQEHAGLVVAPTRMVGFCRDVWSCLQAWMMDQAAAQAQQQQHQQVQQQQNLQDDASTRKRKSMVSFPGNLAKEGCESISLSPAPRKRVGLREERQEPPIVWLCRALLPTATRGAKQRRDNSTPSKPGAATASGGDFSEGKEDNKRVSKRTEADAEAKRHGDALRSALNRKSLSLDIARAIRLHGSTAGGARAVEEIEGLVRAYVTTKTNARARQLRRDRGTPQSQSKPSPPPQPVSSLKSSGSDAEYEKERKSEDGDGTSIVGTTEPSVVESSMANAAADTANSEVDVYREIVGNEVLFTTPTGFTVLQLAAALGLPEVTAFLIEKYKLDPLYVPAQDLYTDTEVDALARSSGRETSLHRAPTVKASPGDTRASVMASAASSPLFVSLSAAVAAAAIATTSREEEEEQLRVLNTYTVRAVARLVTARGTEMKVASNRSAAPAAQASSRTSVNSARGKSENSGNEGDGSSGSSGGVSTWFCWTPYRLAVRTGNVDVVRTLLCAVDCPKKGPVAKKNANRFMSNQMRKAGREDEAECVDGKVSGSDTPALRIPPSHIVDFKEPQWVDPLQRTALQERIAVITGAPGEAAASSYILNASNRAMSTTGSASGAPGTAPFDTPGHGRGTTLAAAADMVALLLRYGAQPNGLFDSTGCDAWMLALSDGGGGADSVAHATSTAAAINLSGAGNGSEEHDDGGGAGVFPMAPFGVSGSESCLSLLLRLHTPLLGRTPVLPRKQSFSKATSLDETADCADTSFDEQLLQCCNTLLRKWKRLACMRGSNSSATRDKFAIMKHRFVNTAAFASAGSSADTVNEGDFVFDVAESLSKVYLNATQGDASVPPSHAASPQLDDLSISSLRQPALAAFMNLEQSDADAGNAFSAFNPISDGGGGAPVLLPPEQTTQYSLLWHEDDHPLNDNADPHSESVDTVQSCKGKLVAALRLCYRVVLMYLCIDHAPQQLLRLLHAYTLDMIPVRARHPFSGDTIVTRLLRKARERLLTSGATPTENEVGDMMDRVMDGVSRLNLSGQSDARYKNSGAATAVEAAAGQPFAQSQQRAYRDPTEDTGASILIHTSLALIQLLPRLDDSGPFPITAEPRECAMLQSILFQPSFDNETALSLAARLAHVPLISAIVQSAASPLLLDEIANGEADWGSKRSSRFASRRPSRDSQQQRKEHTEENKELRSTAAIDAALSRTFSLASNLKDVMVRVLLATRVYYPAHEITTVRILLHCMPDEPARLDFFRWVYPNIHPLPALQLAMDYVDVAAHFLTTPDCMNALWTNLLYTHFTDQLNTVVQASSKAWNALLKVVLPGAPAVPIYLVLKGALRMKNDGDVGVASAENRGGRRFTELERHTTSATSLRSANASTAKRKNSHRAKKVELTNWSYLVRRTTIFLQLMAMSVAETLMGKTTTDGSFAGGSTATAANPGLKSGVKHASNATQRDGKGGVESGFSGGAAAAIVTSVDEGIPTVTRGLAGTLLLDTLELAVRYDDREVLHFLMQLRLPEIVIKYVHQVQQQQQQNATNSSFPVSLAVQSANARAIESANTTILSSYPSFAGVRSMTQASAVLDRLQRQLWKEAIQERHLDLIAVVAGAVRTLRSLYTSRHSNVASLLTPMRYDRIDVKTGYPDGVVCAAPPPRTPSPSILSPTTESGTSASCVVSPVDPLNTTTSHSGKQLLTTGTARAAAGIAGAEVVTTGTEQTASNPPSHQPNSKAMPRSPAQLEMEEEQHFVDSCLQSGRLAPREERRRRVTMVTWGIGGLSCPIDLPANRVSLSAAALNNGDNVTVDRKNDEENVDEGRMLQKSGHPAEYDGAAAHQLSSLASLSSPVPPRLPSAPFTAAATTTSNTTGASSKQDAKRAPRLALSKPAVNTTPAGQSPRLRKAGTSAQIHTNSSHAATARVQVPTLSLPATHSFPTPSPPRVEDPVYFMYLQLDWAMFSTRLLRSPQPSTATVDTILFLMEHRCALSVPVLDLFLSGLTVTASRFVVDAAVVRPPTFETEDATRQRSYANFSEVGEDTQTVTIYLSLRYRTRQHRDTLLHLLVLHDQCQLAEYYLEYCYFFFVSHQIDPEPKNGHPGRFPIHEQPRQRNSPGDALSHVAGDKDCSFRTVVLPHTPIAFLRMMLRVNAHGLTAFDYAHSPAMLQLLEWYGCVPPTYRPNPRLFRQVLSSRSNHNNGDAKELGNARGHSDASESGEADEVTGWEFVGEDEEDEEDESEVHPHRNKEQKAASRCTHGDTTLLSTKESDHLHQPQKKRKRAPLRFFPVPRLVLATDNFVTLFDLTGMEIASTAPQSLTVNSNSRRATSTTTTTQADADDDEADRGGGGNALQEQRPERQQLRANRHLAALITTEKKQFQQAQRRREQQEMAKAMLFEQVAMQPLVAATQSASSPFGKGGKGKTSSSAAESSSAAPAARRRGPANPPYLSRVVTANLRERWDAHRHPPVSDTVLWHNALEAQRQSSLIFASNHFARNSSGNTCTGRDATRKGILPILLSEEVSLLHLGLCTFDDELVTLYGELHAPSSSSSQHQQQRLLDKQGRFAGDNGDGRDVSGGDASSSNSNGGERCFDATAAAEAQLSAYNRMFLPPMLTGKTVPHEQQQQQQQSQPNNNTNSGLGKGRCSEKVRLGGHEAKLSISVASSSVAAAGHSMRNSSVTAAAAAPPPPPRLSHTDIVFLLECQQFVVFPLALPNVMDDDLSLDDANAGALESGGDASTAVSGGALVEQHSSRGGDIAMSFHGSNATSAVIERCTGGSDGCPSKTRRRTQNRTSTSSSVGAGSGLGKGTASQLPSRVRSRADATHHVTDVPLLRALLARQAATITDLVDITPRRYDVALLVSLTPMQLSGAVGGNAVATSGRNGGADSTVTLRALSERLTSTQYKQFGSRVVTAPAGTSTRAFSTAAVTHQAIETVAVLHVPPFVTNNTMASAASVGTVAAQQQQQRGVLHSFTHSNHEDSANSWETVTGSATATGAAPALSTTDPTVMAARMEEWVLRRWPAQHKLMPAKKTAVVSTNTQALIHAFATPQSPRPQLARSGVGASPSSVAGTAQLDSSSLALPSALDRVTPVGGVATATQQSLMRALLKRFSAATGARLSEQMGLIITPNYDVDEVGDAAAAQRGMAAKGNSPTQKKRR